MINKVSYWHRHIFFLQDVETLLSRYLCFHSQVKNSHYVIMYNTIVICWVFAESEPRTTHLVNLSCGSPVLHKVWMNEVSIYWYMTVMCQLVNETIAVHPGEREVECEASYYTGTFV